jgi:hypothetical protein
MFVILYSNVYEPPSYLRGGGMYLGRPKYIVVKKKNAIHLQEGSLNNMQRCNLCDKLNLKIDLKS